MYLEIVESRSSNPDQEFIFILSLGGDFKPRSISLDFKYHPGCWNDDASNIFDQAIWLINKWREQWIWLFSSREKAIEVFKQNLIDNEKEIKIGTIENRIALNKQKIRILESENSKLASYKFWYLDDNIEYLDDNGEEKTDD
jgi:hypothetical protein